MTLETVLRGSEHRVTKPRQLVWDVLLDAQRHLSAADIVAEVHRRDPGVNPSSVYRALTLFTELNIVRESHVGDTSMWEPAHDDAVIHLVCDHCGRTMHYDTSAVSTLRRQLQRHADFSPGSIDVRVSGRCAHCARST